jgi:hypothetical protein
MFDDLTVAQGCCPVRREAQDEVVVIAHQRVGAEVDGEDLGQQGKSFEDARLAMLE